MIILALDGLDLNPVIRYRCKHLQQTQHAQTDVSYFKLLRTVALWASFLSGSNMEEMIPIDNEAQWRFTLNPEQTFLPLFDSYRTIDVPAFSFKQRNHSNERMYMRQCFSGEVSVEDFDAVVWRNHDENYKEFFRTVNKYDLVMGYFDLADAIGHLSFGVSKKMKTVYAELDDLAREVRTSFDDFLLIVSDHGMHQVGRYGEHDENGFYSVNRKLGLGLLKITDFFDVIKQVAVT